jgi:hypothetical protein
MRIAAATVGGAWLIVLAAFVYAASSVQPGGAGIVAALAALLIGGTAILYAWREPGR